ncbi:MAG: hypothetical protein ACTSU0_04020, partial [Alphaproteobacteria bacterium]
MWILSAAALAAPERPARAGNLDILTMNAPITALRQAGADVFVRAGRWLRLRPCAEAVMCTTHGA